MSDDWLISAPFEYANEEDAQWRFHDTPGQTHREDLVGWEAKNRSGVKGRLVEVVHGYKGKDEGRPRTLVVFEWRLIPGGGENRIKNVEIIVAFQAIGYRDGVKPGESVAHFDPVPIRWAPDKMMRDHFSKATVTEAVNTEYGAQAGYSNYFTLSGKRNTGSSQTVERVDFRFISGSPTYEGKSSGTRNAVKWELSENAQLKSGVQHEVRTAVLLRREPYDFGKFEVVIQADANSTGMSRKLQIMKRALRIRSADGPAAFDPMITPGSSDGEAGEDNVAARATTRDWQDLDEKIIDLKASILEDWDIDSAEELAIKTAQVSSESTSEAQ